MANKISPKQIYIDTAILAAGMLNEKIYAGDVIQWNLTGGAAGNQAVITAADGTLIYNGLASMGNYMDRYVVPQNYMAGFYVPTLSAGGVITITRCASRV